MADLSVYYCHQLFAHFNTKAVTFDSPGSGFMLTNRLEMNAIKGESFASLFPR